MNCSTIQEEHAFGNMFIDVLATQLADFIHDKSRQMVCRFQRTMGIMLPKDLQCLRAYNFKTGTDFCIGGKHFHRKENKGEGDKV